MGLIYADLELVSAGDLALVRNFLNSVITFENDQKIQSLTIVDPYNIPMLKEMKDTYVVLKQSWIITITLL